MKLIDIGFLFGFSWIGKRFFSMEFGYLINVVEHQSTSGTKIHSPVSLYKSSIALLFMYWNYGEDGKNTLQK